jgi:hypothetical protein
MKIAIKNDKLFREFLDFYSEITSEQELCEVIGKSISEKFECIENSGVYTFKIGENIEHYGKCGIFNKAGIHAKKECLKYIKETIEEFISRYDYVIILEI